MKFKIGDLVEPIVAASVLSYGGMPPVVFEIVSLGGETCHLLPSCQNTPGLHYHARSFITGKLYYASENIKLHLSQSNELTPEQWFQKFKVKK